VEQLVDSKELVRSTIIFKIRHETSTLISSTQTFFISKLLFWNVLLERIGAPLLGKRYLRNSTTASGIQNLNIGPHTRKPDIPLARKRPLHDLAHLKAVPGVETSSTDMTENRK
jgi:hypothetical protein